MKRVLKYIAADGNRTTKQIVRANFDAGLDESSKANDYDVLLATDALSEGYNLHRAGIVINYDIPYNPTRVIQRVGRINRINKKVFDKLYIFNCFPTDTGEGLIKVKQISTLKMRLIGSVMGSDTKTLTDDEKLESFFKDEFKKASDENDSESWDAQYREDYENAIKQTGVLEKALKIKPRSRVVRTNHANTAVVAFGKKGDHAIFAVKEGVDPSVVPSEVALRYFKAEQDEKGTPADEQYDEVFKMVRDLLFEKHPLPVQRGRRLSATDVIKTIESEIPEAKDYCKDLSQIIKKYDGINEGDLKSIAQLNTKDVHSAYEKLQIIVPKHQILSINERAAKLDSEYETILLSEDLRK